MVRSRIRRTRVGAALLIAAAIVVAVVVIVLLQSSKAHARTGIESMFQDDQALLYQPTPSVVRSLDTLQSLGVDRLRLTVLWAAIAPDPLARTRPAGFDAADPVAYPAAGWVPYDRIVALARARGIDVDFNVTAPGPLWAMAPSPPNAKAANHYRPSATEFGSFVAAVGKRYSGTFVSSATGGGSAPLPRVSFWTIWNEPNQPGWLSPQWGSVGGSQVMVSPQLYRSYANAAYRALQRTGHGTGTDTILIGELAPEGLERAGVTAAIPPLSFLRSMYCLDGGYQPLKGSAAAQLGCPQDGNISAFVSANPGLFQPTGFAHHPYSFFLAPSASMSDPNFAPLSDLGRLEHSLDQSFAAYGVGRQLPIYLTEYGYETNPPNPYRGVAPPVQSRYLNEAQYMAWRDPRVRAMAQFLLYDSPPNPSFPPGSVGYWSTFQTGLLYLNGAAKPAFSSYRLPIWVPTQTFSSGAQLMVWGMLRLAPNNATQHAQIQWRPAQGTFQTLATVTTSDPTGEFTDNVSPPGSGVIRIAWTSPTGQRFFSREVGVQSK